MNRKGQGAMEYLLNYSWAILIVLVIGMVLWQMGVFNTKTAATFRGWDEIRPMAPTVLYSASDSHFEASFSNIAGAIIEVTDVTVNDTGDNCNNVKVNGIDMPGSVLVDEGNLFKITTTCSSKKADEAYNMHIRIKYDARLKAGVTSHTTEGFIESKVED